MKLVMRTDDFGYTETYNRFYTARVIDIAALCSPLLKQWIVEHQVELVNMRDVLLGTQEYQNHLRAVGSPLYISK